MGVFDTFVPFFISGSWLDQHDRAEGEFTVSSHALCCLIKTGIISLY